MADYQSLLTRAVANLPKGHAPTARQAIYDRARKALVTQLRTLRPPLPESDIAREEAALDRAIEAVEQSFVAAPGSAAQAAPPAPTPAQPAPPPPAAGPSAAPPRPAAPPPPPPKAPQPSAPTAPAPPMAPPPAWPGAAAPAPRPAAPSSPPRPAAPLPPQPVRPSTPPGPPPLRANPPPPPAGAKPAPAVQVTPAAGAAGPTAPPVGPPRPDASAPAPANLAKVVPSTKADATASNAPPIGAARGDHGDLFEAGPIGQPEDEQPAPPSGVQAEGQRPSLPAPAAEKKPRSWLWPALAVLVGVALSVAVVAILMRQKPQDLAIAPPPEPQQTAPPPPAKIAQRAQPSPAEDKTAPAPEAQPQQQAATSGQEQPAQQQPPGQQPPPAQESAQGAQERPATEAPAQGQTQAPAPAAETTLPTSARAALLIASPDNPQKPVVNLGSTVWSVIPAAPNDPSTVAVKADADIPDLKLHATMTLRKNTDPTLQATHTIDLKFTPADGAPIAGFKDVGLPQMRKLDSTASQTLNSVRVKISDDYFLIALAKSDTDTVRNLDLMKTNAWFDFPLLLNDNRIAKLVFQKSAEGQQMLEKAFEAWK